MLPWKAPWRNRLCMNAPTLSRICAHSGSSLGSNTTHFRPRYRLSSMKSASRRIGMYLYSLREVVVAVHRARAPVDDAVREDAQRVDGPRVDHPVLARPRTRYSTPTTPRMSASVPGRRLPDAAGAVDPGHQAGDRAARPDRVLAPFSTIVSRGKKTAL